ncbi:FAD-dependent oxidoreductase [Sphaerotilus mobilis]|nr:FAD-dependent oxidoreductase [Sphaerotilus mobilis]
MQQTQPMQPMQPGKRLLLLGGGHAHVQVLAALAEQPLAGWTVQLVSPWRRQIYSGMLPGWVAGHYPIEACAIDLDPLCRRAGVDFQQTAGTGLDLARQAVHGADGVDRPWDLLSIDTGPVAGLARLPGSADHTLPIRPIERFIAEWPRLVERIRHHAGRFELVILGAGAGGIELAFAIGHRARVEGWSALRLTVVGSEALPLPGAPPRVRRQALDLMRERGIVWHASSRARAVAAGRLHLQDVAGSEGATMLSFDACLTTTGAAAPDWPSASGLATDAGGFIRVDRRLRSVSHPTVFAAGDVAALADARPRSGVYAVRAGPVLADNLRAGCLGQPLRDWTPQARALYLISTGDRHALATWGRWSWRGHWVWRWKDHIDRAFMRRWADPAPRTALEPETPP